MRYPYQDAAGALVQEVVREECQACPKAHKRFTQEWPTANGRRARRTPPGFERVLYRLPQVLAAIQAGRTVWVLEGEKDVHTAEEHGLVATTNTQGGLHFTDEYAAVFAKAQVRVVLDRDATGWARGLSIYDKITAAGGQVKLFLPATTEAKSDFTDHVQAGRGLHEFHEVSRAELATWDALSTLWVKVDRVRTAIDEADAHLGRLAAGVDTDTSARHARRWVLEAQIRYEAADEAARAVSATAVEAGTGWAGDAVEQMQRPLETLAGDLRRVHGQCEVPVPPMLQRIVPDAGPVPQPLAVAPSTGFGSSTGSLAGAPTYRIVGNAIYAWEPARRRRGEDDADDAEDEGTLKLVLGLGVRVVERLFLESSGDDLDVDESELLGRESSLDERVRAARPPRQLAGLLLSYIDPLTGEEMTTQISADQWKDHSWLDSLPSSPDYDHRKSGMDVVQRAVLAVSPDLQDTMLYSSTGWRADGERHVYVHARGLITADGHQAARTRLDGPLSRYNLPDPSRDPGVLRRAFVDHSATMLDRIPARVAAPLLGQVFRAVLGPNPWVLAVIGSPGSYKTSVAAKAMHHFGELWDHTKPSSSMSGNGDTLNAMRLKLHNSKDALYWLDDFAPTKRWVDAQKLLEEIARLIHNREERARATRDGLGLTDGTGPRASGLATSEVMPRPGSGAERMLVVPLAREDIDTALLFPLDEQHSRHARALLMASFVSWLAGDLVNRRRDYLARAAVFAEQLKAAGEAERQAAALANTWIGWVAMTDFLVELDALTAGEQGQLVAQVEEALGEASRAAVDPDLPTRTGARVRELLAYALAGGLAHVDDVKTGADPPWPLARRLGWQTTALDTDLHGTNTKVRTERLGDRLGWVLHDPDEGEPVLYCEPTALEPILKAAAARMTDGMQIDRGTATRALAEEQILLTDVCEQGKTRFTKARIITCEQRKQRVIVLRLHPLLGDNPDDNPQPLSANSPDPRGGGNRANTPCARIFGSSQETAPGPGPDDPQTLDQPATADLASERPPTEETEMAYPDDPPEPVDLADADGVVGWTARAPEPGPCTVCGRTCAMLVGGYLIHPVCWRGSTAAHRNAAGGAEPVIAVTSSTPAAQVPAPPAAGTPPARPTPPQPAAPQPAATRPTAQVKERFRAAAAVVDADQIAVGDGSTTPWPFELRHYGDLGRLVEHLHLGTDITRWKAASGQLWLTAAALSKLGVDPARALEAAPEQRDTVLHELTAEQPLVTSALQDGWYVGGRSNNSVGRWTRLRRDQQRSATIVLLPGMNTDPDTMPLLGGAPEPTVLARRLQLFSQHVGHPFQLSSSGTGLDLMMALRWKDRERLFQPFDPVEPAGLANLEADISWCRPPSAEERAHRYLHGYDRGGSYLAGGSLELGIGEPVHYPEGRPFDRKLPGYWLLEVPEAGEWRSPHPLDPRGDRAGRVRWCTTPAVEFAEELEYGYTILEAYVWPEHGRVIDPWYTRMRDARTQLDVADEDAQAARNQVKLVYASTIGLMGSDTYLKGRPGYAPDRRHHIVSKARINILRRITQIGTDTGRWPVAVTADTILYTSDEADPVAAWPGKPDQLGRGLGQYKPDVTGLLEPHVQYLTGGRYRGKKYLEES